MTQKEKVLKFLEEAAEVPLLSGELAVVLGVPDGEREKLEEILAELTDEGLVVRTKKKRYGAAVKLGYIKGKFCGTERGFGFVEQEDGEDLFIPPDSTGGALHGDLVLAKVTTAAEQTKRQEGVVMSVLRRSQSILVGSYEKSGSGGYVVLDDKRMPVDLFIPEAASGGAKDGDKVVAEVVRWESRKRNPEGKITEVLGNRLEVGVDIRSILRQHGIPEQFPREARQEAQRAAASDIGNEAEKRVDFRDHLIFTIDGDDAKDLDDAVEIRRLEDGGYRLGVHIADVGHYVRRGGALDKEAFKRGTSVYLVDRVIPMLPVELSNGICSLNEGVDRLALSVIMDIGADGNVTRHEIAKSVIRSKARMTYHDVTAILEGDKSLRERYSFLLESILLMKELKDILRKRRMARGGINFDFPEAKVVLDADGRPVDIARYEITESNHIIEEFMLICNETVAQDMFRRETPFVYRVHEMPTEEKIQDFAEFAAAFGYFIKRGKDKVHPREFQKLLHKIKGKREERIISTVMLRSLMKARYSAENLGHFGLAAKYYCHFTSPIRRYPDLVIHRIIGNILAGHAEKQEELARFAVSAAEQSSEREICAMEAERDTVDLKKAEYMAERVGEIYAGVISSVTSFGIFVELENTVEGLIRMADLDDDYYIYDEKKRLLLGEHTKRVYQVGDEVTIQVARADALSRQIDFVLHQEGGARPMPKPVRKKGKESVEKKPGKRAGKAADTKHKQKRYLKKKKKRRG